VHQLGLFFIDEAKTEATDRRDDSTSKTRKIIATT